MWSRMCTFPSGFCEQTAEVTVPQVTVQCDERCGSVPVSSDFENDSGSAWANSREDL